MDETMEDTSKTPIITTRQQTTSPRKCKVCAEPAQYSYFGAIVCRSCKVFFRRNAEKRSVSLQCNYNGNCEIDVNSRRSCTYCRLAKCFASGMMIEMIRASQSVKHKKDAEKHLSTALVRVNEPPMMPTLNLLRADQSTLSTDQWNQISNIVHCFDNYSGLPFIQTFINEQNALPPKFRFKYTPVSDFFTSMMTNIQLVFEKNRDFLTISPHDRNTLLRHTIEYTTGIGSACILRQAQLFDRPAFFESAELIFRPPAVALIKRLIDQIDPDISLMKIICAVIAFMISNYTTYPPITSDSITDSITITRTQDMYTDLIWRYLIYKHNHRDAVSYFHNLIRCLILLNDSVVQAHEVQEYTDMMDSVMISSEQKDTSTS